VFREAIGWYASIFFALFLTGIGLPPMPEEAGILYAASLTALHPEVHWWLAWPLTGLGIVCADMALYGIGRTTGPRVFDFRLVRRVIPPERRRRIERKFAAHGVKILLMARLLPPLRTGVFIMAGAIRFSFVRFLLADLAYAVVGVGVLFFAGQWVIALIHWVAEQFTAWTGLPARALLWMAVGAVLAYLLFKFYGVLKEHEVREEVPPPAALTLPQVAEAVQAGVATVEKLDPDPIPPKKAKSGE
jgi:membrane protein DedA with SNARE-associated domain